MRRTILLDGPDWRIRGFLGLDGAEVAARRVEDGGPGWLPSIVPACVVADLRRAHVPGVTAKGGRFRCVRGRRRHAGGGARHRRPAPVAERRRVGMATGGRGTVSAGAGDLRVRAGETVAISAAATGSVQMDPPDGLEVIVCLPPRAALLGEVPT